MGYTEYLYLNVLMLFMVIYSLDWRHCTYLYYSVQSFSWSVNNRFLWSQGQVTPAAAVCTLSSASGYKPTQAQYMCNNMYRFSA